MHENAGEKRLRSAKVSSRSVQSANVPKSNWNFHYQWPTQAAKKLVAYCRVQTLLHGLQYLYPSLSTRVSFNLSIFYRSPPSLRVAGLFLRRRADKAFHTYINLLEYNPSDYEVLLRSWPTEPFLHHLGAFSGPVITGEDPVQTLLDRSQSWTVNLATKAGVTGVPGMQGRRAVFLSVHGGGRQVAPLSGKPLELGVIMCYVVPVTHSGKQVA